MAIYILSLLTYIFILAFHYKRSDLLIFFWLAVGVSFYIPVAAHVGGDYYSYSRSVVDTAVLFSLFSNLVYLCFAFVFLNGGVWGRAGIEKFAVEIDRYGRTLSFFAFITVFLLVLSAYMKFGTILNIGWRDAKSNPLYLPLLYVYYVTSISAFVFFLKRNFFFLVLYFSFVVLVVLIYQSRSLLLPPLIPFAAYYLLYKRNLLYVLVGFVAFVVLFLGVQQYRYVGADSFDYGVAAANAREKILYSEGDLGIVEAFYYLIDSPENVEGVFEARTFRRIVFFYLPGGVLGLKPPDFSHALYSSYTGKYGVGGSMHPTFYGMMYANLGWLGCLGGVFVLLVNKLYRLIVGQLRVSYVWGCSFFSSCLVLMARGSVYNSFVVLVVGFSLMIFFVAFSRAWKKE